MNEIMIFKHPDFGELRAIEIGGEPWMAGKDVATALGYQNVSKALADHVDAEDKFNNESLSSLGQRGGWLINESGLYSLILSSRLPNARKFKRWVTAEVLPSIRRRGACGSPSTIESVLTDPDTIIQLALNLRAEQERRKRLEAEIQRNGQEVRLPTVSSIKEMPKSLFPQRLASLRKERGLTQTDLAVILERGRSTISGYEVEGKEPSLTTLCFLACYFGVSTDYLLGISDKQE